MNLGTYGRMIYMSNKPPGKYCQNQNQILAPFTALTRLKAECIGQG